MDTYEDKNKNEVLVTDEYEDIDYRKSFEGIIVRGDKLYRRFWVSPEFEDENCEIVIKEGYYDEKDITDKLPEYLPYSCLIDEATTLRDFFKLLDKHKDFLGILFHRYYITEYLEYGLNCPVLKKEYLAKSKYFDDLDYLEICPYLEHIYSEYVNEDVYLEMTSHENPDKNLKMLLYKKDTNVKEHTWSMIQFRGKSIQMTKEIMLKRGYTSSAENDAFLGKRINIGFFGNDINWLMDCIIKQETLIEVHESYPISKKWEKNKWGNFFDISLFGIIYSIFHEISFHGGVEESKKKQEEWINQDAEIKECIVNK